MKKLIKLYLILYIVQLIIISSTVYPYMCKDWLMIDYFPDYLNVLYSKLYLYAYYIYTISILIIWTLPYILFIKKKKLTLKQIKNKSIVSFIIFAITVYISRMCIQGYHHSLEKLYMYIIPFALIFLLIIGIVILVLFIIFKSLSNNNK